MAARYQQRYPDSRPYQLGEYARQHLAEDGDYPRNTLLHRNEPLAEEAQQKALAIALVARETNQELTHAPAHISANAALSAQAKKILLLTPQILCGCHSTYVAIADHLSKVDGLCPK